MLEEATSEINKHFRLQVYVYGIKKNLEKMYANGER